jgi:3-phenylpropionate/cinnamic acid dioxygenase small subunit
MSLEVRKEVEDLIVRAFVAIDEREWDTLHGCMTDPVILDMTSLVGSEPSTVSPEVVSSIWSEGFATLDHIHHQVSNFRTTIDGDRAEVKCYGIAFHHRSDIQDPIKWRRFVGTYEFDLLRGESGWAISRLMFICKFIEGNLQLENAI